MKISKISLENFKRFSDLTIDLSSKEQLPKLVLLIGANGSGKSAVFDAFEVIDRFKSFVFQDNGSQYYLKNKQENGKIEFTVEDKEPDKFYIMPNNENYSVNYPPAIPYTVSFYGRSAVRYLPRLTRTNIQAIDASKNQDKPNYYIDMDNRFENDLDTLMYEIMETVFKGINISDNEFVNDLHSFLARINDALRRIFGENEHTSLKYVSFLPPADGKPIQLMFQKGVSTIHYDVLSSGEKEVINILFNLLVRTKHYPSTIYFFDELDTHLHTELQYNLLKEIVENWIPEDSQIWTASHSLGFIRYAQSSENGAIIDFDNLDFDQPQVLTPNAEKAVYDIAVPSNMLPYLFKDKEIFFCENSDAQLFNLMERTNTVFLGLHDKSGVFLRIENTQNFRGIIDRDYLANREVEQLHQKYPNLYILDYYCIENYLFHPDNLKEVKPDFDETEYKIKLTELKNKNCNELIRTLDKDRNSYIFFTKKILTEYDRKEGFSVIKTMLESDDFETFYRVFSMKNRKDLCGIPNINKNDLARTKWFRSKFIELLSIKEDNNI